MTENRKETILEKLKRLLPFFCMLIALAFALPSVVFSKDDVVNRQLKSLMEHFFAVLALFLYLGKKDIPSFRFPNGKTLRRTVPCFLVVLNNLPFLALLDGRAEVERTVLLPLLFFNCLSIGLFEELVFRGILLPYALKRYSKDRKSRFLVLMISSAVFGLVHLLNLLEGAGFSATIMQVGYSFLVGGMCSVVFLYSDSLLLPVILHSVFDFMGAILPNLSTESSTWWDLPTVLWTALLALFTFAHLIVILHHTPMEENDEIR